MSVSRCGRQIVWGVTADGRKVPLDPNVKVFAIFKRGDISEVVETTLSMASHYANQCEACKRNQ